MPDFTDRAPRSEAPRTLLITMADRLDQDPEHDPGAPLAPGERIDLVRDLSGDNPSALLDITPPITAPISRSAYAARLRTIAGVR
jgi:hypothetical protein